MFSTSPFFFVGVEAADVLSLCHLLQLRLRVDALLGAVFAAGLIYALAVAEKKWGESQ